MRRHDATRQRAKVLWFFLLRKNILAFFFAFFLPFAAQAEPGLWLVQSPTAKIYLFGTMHILPNDSLWFGPKIAAAFADSHELWEEADVGLAGTKGVPNMMARATSPDADLWAELPTETAEKFRALLKDCHLPASSVAHFQPWFAAMLPAFCQLTAQSKGHEAVAGPEVRLMERARDAGKRVDFFETADQQISYLADAPRDVQLRQLRGAINENGKAAFAGLESSRVAGNLPVITKLIEDSKKEDPASFAILFTRRNEHFASRIAELLRGHSNIFVAIGAGHLAGPDSVQAQLEKQGIHATRL